MSDCPAFWPVAAATIAALAIGLFFYARALKRLLEEEKPLSPERQPEKQSVSRETPEKKDPKRYY